MKRAEIGRYETTRVASEGIRAFVPHPAALSACRLGCLAPAGTGISRGNPCQSESNIGDIGRTSNLSAAA